MKGWLVLALIAFLVFGSFTMHVLTEMGSDIIPAPYGHQVDSTSSNFLPNEAVPVSSGSAGN